MERAKEGAVLATNWGPSLMARARSTTPSPAAISIITGAMNIINLGRDKIGETIGPSPLQRYYFITKPQRIIGGYEDRS